MLLSDSNTVISTQLHGTSEKCLTENDAHIYPIKLLSLARNIPSKNVHIIITRQLKVL